MIDIRIQLADFDPGGLTARLEALHRPAVATFTAIAAVPDEAREFRIDHYPAMAKKELAAIGEEACARWPLAAVIVVHRHGLLKPGARIAFVGVAAEDADAAQEACAHVTGQIRARAPFWRRVIPGSARAEGLRGGPADARPPAAPVPELG